MRTADPVPDPKDPAAASMRTGMNSLDRGNGNSTKAGGSALSRKALLLFIVTSVIWGSSFLFIRLAVERVPPSAVAFGRTFLAAAVLIPLALRSGAFRGLRGKLIPLVLVAMLDMALPHS
jgi:EamA-like transporter family